MLSTILGSLGRFNTVQPLASVDVELIHDFSATGFQADPEAMAIVLGMYGFRFRATTPHNHWHVLPPCAVHLNDAACMHKTFSAAVSCCARTLLQQKVFNYLSDRWLDQLPQSIMDAPACSEAGLRVLAIAHPTENLLQLGVVRENADLLMQVSRDQILLLVPLAEEAKLSPQHRAKYESTT